MINRVSVIITTYNYASFLAQSIESVLNQTYADIELIVVNDGSTDSTNEVIKPYLARLRYIDQSNAGVVIARNNGALQATGDYLLFLDADDYLPAGYIAESVKTLVNQPEIQFVYGDRQVFGQKEYRSVSEEWNPQLLLLKNYIGLSSLVSKSAFESVGGFSLDLNQVKSYEDWDLWLKLSVKGYQGLYNAQLYYYYRRLDEHNRNKATTLLKIRLRLPIMWKYRQQYFKIAFIWAFPGLLCKSVLSKRRLLSGSRIAT